MEHVYSHTVAFTRPLPVMAKRPPKASPATLDSIAGRLQITREASGMIQAQFCRVVGISPAAWNNYEQGRRRIRLDEALQLCSALGVTLDWIYRGIAAGLPLTLAEEIQRIQRLNQRRSA